MLKHQSKSLIAHFGSKTYIIKPDLPEIGAYLFIYENGQDIADYLQDSVEHCIEFAFRKFGVSMDSWYENERDGLTPRD